MFLVKKEKKYEIKVKGEFMGKQEEMRLEVIDKEQNKRLVTRQIEGQFKRCESIQEFQDSNNGNNISASHIRHTIDYELQLQERLQTYFQAAKQITR